MRASISAAVLLAAAGMAAPARAAQRAVDKVNDVTFTLSGRALTVRLGADTPAALRAKLNGKKVAFICTRELGDLLPAHRIARWTTGKRTMTVTMSKTIKNPLACGVEQLRPARPGASADITYGFFRSPGF